jgi:hypothetical protein
MRCRFAATKEKKRIADALSRLDADTRRVLGDHEATRQVQVIYLANISQKDERLAIAMLLVAEGLKDVWAAHRRLVEVGVQTVLSREHRGGAESQSPVLPR